MHVLFNCRINENPKARKLLIIAQKVVLFADWYRIACDLTILMGLITVNKSKEHSANVIN